VHLRGIAQNRPRYRLGMENCNPMSFGKVSLIMVFKVLQQVFWLDFDSLTFQAAGKGKDLPHDIRTPFWRLPLMVSKVFFCLWTV